MKIDKRDIKIEKMASDLWKMRFDDSYGVENYFLEEFISKYVSNFFPEIVKNLEFLIENNGKHRDYGDIDFVFEILVNTKNKKVLLLKDNCSTAPIATFLIFIEKTPIEETVHFRSVWDYDGSDNKRGNKYIKRPDLKWYKNRKYSLEFSEELHETKFGGSYADCRDAGYILTAKRINYEHIDIDNSWRFEGGMIHNWWKIEFIGNRIFSAKNEIENE